MRHIILCLLVATSLHAAPIPEWTFVPPKDSGVANVKDFGAKGDGVTDDTAAIAQAISANIDKSRYRSNPFIWFPNGTYLVSGPIEGRVQAPGVEEGRNFSAGWRSMLMLMLIGGLLYTLGNKREHAPLVPAFTNEKGKVAISYRTNGIPATYYKNVLRMDNFQTGADLTSDKIKGPGAALLTDER